MLATAALHAQSPATSPLMTTPATPPAAPTTVRSLAPVLVVEAIAPSLAFWRDRLGFAVTAEVPHEGEAGFAMLERDGITVMLQTAASVAADVPAMAGIGTNAALFLVVDDLAAIERAVPGDLVVLPRRRTFYGMDEIGVREPGGHVVTFAQPVPDAS